MMTVIQRLPHTKRFQSVHSFERWANAQDRSYEFVNKKVALKELIKNYDLLVIYWLNEFFATTAAFKNKGKLISEVGIKLPKGNFRIPDLAYFTVSQIEAAAQGQYPIPALCVEFLSDSEGFGEVENKINDYFEAGVQVVWYINHANQSIYCYRSPKDIQYLTDNDMCSAAPTIPDFQFAVKEIFKKEIGVTHSSL